ncbi:hypothetical protein [Bradyrhizobium sp. SBR1B]|uniref:hypothetical protein n=1 Tax=Bradyrhizobium sp. SBR1B TaxID=2663836 RepID=UPI0016058D71|nr:hypothetical protein [Bradyrhizobium sp. SBR1B]MBB4383384.1 hypothetical protein [Bradyrhizobium sp. SBR1B]
MVREVIHVEASHWGDARAENGVAKHAEPQLPNGISPPLDEDPRTEHQEDRPAGYARWRRYTAALLGVNGAQGAFETFVGRLSEAAVLGFSGHPQSPEEVSDRSMAAHAVVNVVMGLVAGARAGLHTWRARRNPEAYRRAFCGERPTQSAALAMAGTPDVPASQLTCLLSGLAAGVVTFGGAAHAGIRALSHLRSSSKDKVNAYDAVVRSNANTAYCYTREVANFVAHAFQLVSHDALLTPLAAAATTLEYGFNFALQQSILDGMNQAGSSAHHWPSISAVAEAVDVAFTSGMARLAEPDRSVGIWRGRLAEGTSVEGHQPSRLSVIDAIDRVTQRAVGRQLVGEIHHSMPGIGPVLAAGTHLRELTWQAERASRGVGNSTPPSDIESRSPGGTQHAGSRSGPLPLRQNAAEFVLSPGT